MSRLRIGVTRYGSVAAVIERRLALAGRARCHFGHGRLYIVLRGVGATRWDPGKQVAEALSMAAVAREALRCDTRAAVRARAEDAIVVRFEDVAASSGCRINAQWECVIPSAAGR